MRAFQAVVVSGKQRVTHPGLPFHALETFQKLLGLFLMELKLGSNRRGIAAIEAVLRKLLLLGKSDISVSLVRGPPQRVNTLNVLQERADPLEPVSQLDGNGVDVYPA